MASEHLRAGHVLQLTLSPLFLSFTRSCNCVSVLQDGTIKNELLFSQPSLQLIQHTDCFSDLYLGGACIQNANKECNS